MNRYSVTQLALLIVFSGLLEAKIIRDPGGKQVHVHLLMNLLCSYTGKSASVHCLRQREYNRTRYWK